MRQPSLQHLSRHVSQHQEHMLSYVKGQRESERQTDREKGTAVTSEVQKFIAVTEEIYCMSALSNLVLIFKEGFDKIWNFSMFLCRFKSIMVNHI